MNIISAKINCGIMILVISTIVLSSLSAYPFCSGVKDITGIYLTPPLRHSNALNGMYGSFCFCLSFSDTLDFTLILKNISKFAVIVIEISFWRHKRFINICMNPLYRYRRHFSNYKFMSMCFTEDIHFALSSITFIPSCMRTIIFDVKLE